MKNLRVHLFSFHLAVDPKTSNEDAKKDITMATRESFAIIMATALLTTFDPGVALQCRLCNSLTNANCWNDMADVELVECGGTVRLPDFGSPPSTSHESPTPTTPASSTKTEAPAMTNPKTEPPFRKSHHIIPMDPEYICYSLIYKSRHEDVMERGCSPKTTTCHQIEENSGGKAQCNACGHDDCNGSASIGIGLGFFFILAPTALIAVFRW